MRQLLCQAGLMKNRRKEPSGQSVGWVLNPVSGLMSVLFPLCSPVLGFRFWTLEFWSCSCFSVILLYIVSSILPACVIGIDLLFVVAFTCVLSVNQFCPSCLAPFVSSANQSPFSLSVLPPVSCSLVSSVSTLVLCCALSLSDPLSC